MAYLVYTLHIPMISILAGILVFMLPGDIYALYLYATENCSASWPILRRIILIQSCTLILSNCGIYSFKITKIINNY